MAEHVTHPVDPKCPYCAKTLRQYVEERRKQTEAAAKPKPNGVIEGSERVRFPHLDDGKEQIPSWASLDTQPEILRQRLTKPSKNTPRK